MSFVGLAGVPLAQWPRARRPAHAPAQVVDRGAQDQLRRGIAVNLDIARRQACPVPGVFGMRRPSSCPWPVPGSRPGDCSPRRWRPCVSRRSAAGRATWKVAHQPCRASDISPVGRPDAVTRVSMRFVPPRRRPHLTPAAVVNRRQGIAVNGRTHWSSRSHQCGPDGHRHRHIAFQRCSRWAEACDAADNRSCRRRRTAPARVPSQLRVSVALQRPAPPDTRLRVVEALPATNGTVEEPGS